jgi:hypothetical protein
VDGQCAGMGQFEGIPIHGDVPKMIGGYVALWLSVEFEGEENGHDFVTVCDDLKYVMTQGPGNFHLLSSLFFILFLFIFHFSIVN